MSNGTALEIWPCTVAEAGRLSMTAVRSYKDFYQYLWEDGGLWYINHSFTEPVLRNDILIPGNDYFLLSEKGEDIGFLKIRSNKALEHFENYNSLEIERIYLIRSASGKGYGRQAMEFCFEQARKKNNQIVWLKSMDSTPAIFFYKKMGFEQCGTLQLQYPRMKVEFRGMVLMMKWV